MITPPDLELWLTTFLRAQLAAGKIAATVSNKEPAQLSAPLSKPLIVIREDGGPGKTEITYTRTCGVSILGGTRQHDQPTKDLARLAYAILTDHETIALAAGSPVVAVEFSGCDGPYTVPDPQDVTRVYFVVEYTVVGSW